VIGETRSVCVMLLAPQVGLALKQAIENMRRVPHECVDDLRVEAFRAPVLRAQCRGEYELLGFSTLSHFWSQIGLGSRRVLCFMLVLRRRSVRGVGGVWEEGDSKEPRTAYGTPAESFSTPAVPL
jgi:hypothetical protein